MMMVFGLFLLIFLGIAVITAKFAINREKPMSERIVYGIMTVVFSFLALVAMPSLMQDLHEKGTTVTPTLEQQSN